MLAERSMSSIHTLIRYAPFLALLSLAFTSCAVPGTPPNDDPWSGSADGLDWRANAAKEVVAAYVANDAEGVRKWLADDATIVFNKKEVDKDTFVTNLGRDHVHFKDIVVNRIVSNLSYNNGGVFTNIWAQWTGKLRKSGEEVKFPLYMYMTWKDRRVEKFVHLYDPTPINEALASIGVKPY